MNDVEVRILNLPDPQSTVTGKYITGACVRDTSHCPAHASHFQYYYTHALNVSPANRFDLKSELYAMKDVSSKDVERRAIYPYKCGMILQGRTGDKIDNDDMN